MKEGETWEKFQGKCIDFSIKLGTNIMCPRFHTKGRCHDCVNSQQPTFQQRASQQMSGRNIVVTSKRFGSWNRSPGQGLAVFDPELYQNPPTSNQSYHHLSSWGQKRENPKNIKDHSIKKNDIAIQWNNGEVKTSV
jgi:hypothetical protein